MAAKRGTKRKVPEDAPPEPKSQDDALNFGDDDEDE